MATRRNCKNKIAWQYDAIKWRNASPFQNYYSVVDSADGDVFNCTVIAKIASNYFVLASEGCKTFTSNFKFEKGATEACDVYKYCGEVIPKKYIRVLKPAGEETPSSVANQKFQFGNKDKFFNGKHSYGLNPQSHFDYKFIGSYDLELDGKKMCSITRNGMYNGHHVYAGSNAEIAVDLRAMPVSSLLQYIYTQTHGCTHARRKQAKSLRLCLHTRLMWPLRRPFFNKCRSNRPRVPSLRWRFTPSPTRTYPTLPHHTTHSPSPCAAIISSDHSQQERWTGRSVDVYWGNSCGYGGGD